MVRIEFQPPDMDPMVRAVMQNLKLRMSFLKNWANSAAIEARGNARVKGGRRYWKDLARSVQVRQVSEIAVSVSSSQTGAGLKQFGGTVRPVHAKALTIPIVPEAKGRTAYEFERPDRPLFVLRNYAKMKPEPWFPTENRIAVLAVREARILHDKEQKNWNTRQT